MKSNKIVICISLILLFAIIISIITVFYTFFYIPKRYKHVATVAANTFSIDKNLILSVMRVESGFNERAVSRVGAVGLMQLMPSTANFIQQSMQEDLDMYNYADNIKMGAWYLKYLKNKFVDVTTVLAAYNAGEGTVLKWLQQDNLSMGDKLKRIPYGETAHYVKRVEKFYRIYTKLWH